MSYKIFYFLIVSLFVSIACTRQPSIINETTRVYDEFEYPLIQSKGKTISDFVPPFWSVDDTIYEDLNGDGRTDALLLLTYTDTSDTTGTYEYPEGVIHYQLFEHRVLLILYKSSEGQEYILNTYCYKLLNPRDGTDELILDLKPGILFVTFSAASNGLIESCYTFEPETKAGRWVLTKTEEEAGNANYETKGSYNFKNDSLHYHAIDWSRAEDDSTWNEFNFDLDTIIHMRTNYYLDVVEYDSLPSPSNLYEGIIYKKE